MIFGKGAEELRLIYKPGLLKSSLRIKVRLIYNQDRMLIFIPKLYLFPTTGIYSQKRTSIPRYMHTKHKQTSFSRTVKIKNMTDLQYAIYTMTLFRGYYHSDSYPVAI